MWLPEQGPPHVVGMWVAPGARGKGVGRELLAAVRDWAGEHGHTRLQLSVMRTQAAARRLYVSSGFEPTGAATPLERDPSLVREELQL